MLNSWIAPAFKLGEKNNPPIFSTTRRPSGGEWWRGRCGFFDPRPEGRGYSSRISSEFNIIELDHFQLLFIFHPYQKGCPLLPTTPCACQALFLPDYPMVNLQKYLLCSDFC
jgi:hypothetical protein